MKQVEKIWQTAIVRCDGDGRRWLEFSDPRDCKRCSSGTGCGAAIFSRLFARPETRVPMPGDNEIPADRLVRVGLDPRWLMLVAAATYLLPVIAFVAGAVFGDRLSPGNDAAALVAGISFALVAGWLARYLLKFIGSPRLKIVDLHAGLESAGDSGHFSKQGT